MADYNAHVQNGPDPDSRLILAHSTNLFDRSYPTSIVGNLSPDLSNVLGAGWTSFPQDRTPAFYETWGGQSRGNADPGQLFFERMHYTPRQIELGNLLSTTVAAIEIYNAYRGESQTFISATNNAGGGITFVGLPTLPVEMNAQTGAQFDVEISTVGPPSIDGTLDFDTDPAMISIPITGSRVVMFAFQPERPVVEILEFLTDTIRATDGSEQRIAQRQYPRQSFEMTLRLPEGDERRRALTLLKGWHPRVFGVPIWWESRQLGADASTGATTITVDTAYGDFRVGSLAIVWSDSDYFDALQIQSVGPNSITFESAITHDFDLDDTLVMPLRVAHSEDTIDIQRFLNALQDVKMRFRVIDNDTGDIGSTAAYSQHNSKVMLDDPNLVTGQAVQDSLFRELQRIDNRTGLVQQFATWNSDIPVTKKGFLGNSLQSVWEARQLFHALRGSQVSFYLPTFYYDMIVVNDLASGSFLMDIENIGYTDYIDGQEPFKSIHIELTDGTILTRQVESSAVIDANTERLTVDASWSSLISTGDIARVSLLRRVRIADDRVTFEHDLPGTAKINMNIRGAY